MYFQLNKIIDKLEMISNFQTIAYGVIVIEFTHF